MTDLLIPHVGFLLSPSMQSKSNRFLESVEGGDKRSGEMFFDVIQQLSTEVIDNLLLQTISIAQMSPVAQKVVNVCASSAGKASSMLSGKIYKGASRNEMEQVGKYWQDMLKTDPAGVWHLASPMNQSLAQHLDEILAEKGTSPSFDPRDREGMAHQYEQLSVMVIEQFFIGPSERVDMGFVTRKMLNLGVDGVKQAANAVIHKVIKKLEPAPLGAYVDHTSQFYVRLP